MVLQSSPLTLASDATEGSYDASSDSMSAINGQTPQPDAQTNGHHTDAQDRHDRMYSMQRYLDEPLSIPVMVAVRGLQADKPDASNEDHSESLFSEGSSDVAGEMETEMELGGEESDGEEVSGGDEVSGGEEGDEKS